MTMRQPCSHASPGRHLLTLGSVVQLQLTDPQKEGGGVNDTSPRHYTPSQDRRRVVCVCHLLHNVQLAFMRLGVSELKDMHLTPLF